MEYAVKGETRDGRITILAVDSTHTRTPRIIQSKCRTGSVYGSNSSHPR